jgi:hypothetical protein
MGDRVDQHGRALAPRLIAKSSTPSTATVPTSGSGSACTSRNSVLRPAHGPSRVDRHEPARPASASPMCSKAVQHNDIRRAC